MKNRIIAFAVGLALAFSVGCLPFALGLALVLSVGCQSTGNPRQEMLAQAAVVYATAKVVKNNPTYGPRIAQIASEVRAVAKGESFASVDLLMAFVRSKIDFGKLSKSPADVAMVNLLLDAVRAELVARLGSVELPAEKMLVVEKVATWIEQAALAATPK